MKNKALAIRTLVFTALLMLFACGATAQLEFVWYFNDGPQQASDGVWTDTGMGPLWEHMGPNDIEVDDFSCSVMDLPPDDVPIWACSDPDDGVYVDQHWWAEIWLANTWESHSNPVTATLGMGVCGQAAGFIPISQSVTTNVTTYMGDFDCGEMHGFDFGNLALVQPAGQSLILRIVSNGEPLDVHIYWDAWTAPSALHCGPSTATDSRSWSLVKALY